MSFSESSGIITQTGTDTDLSGLVGITGVTTTVSNGRSFYRITNKQLRITGTLSHDPELEEMMFDGYGNIIVVDVRSGGIYNIGQEIDIGAELNRFSSGTAIRFTRATDSNYQESDSDFYISSGGTLNWYGGSMFGRRIFANYGTMNTFSKNCQWINQSSAATQLRQRSTGFNVDGLVTRGCFLTLIANATQIKNWAPYDSSDGNQVLGLSTSTPSNTWLVLEDLDSRGVSAQVLSVWRDKWCRLINNYTGSGIILAGNSDDNAGNTGLYEIRQELALNYKDLGGDPLDGVKFYTIDTNNSNRLASGLIGSSPSYTADRSYSGTSASGTITFNTDGGILVAVLWRTTGGSRNSNNEYDYRCMSGDNTDDFIGYSYKYGYSVTQTTLILKGQNTTTRDIVQLPNFSTTETTKATVDAYTTLDTAAQVKDRADSFLEDNLGTYLDFLITRTGSQIVLGAVDFVVDSTAGSVFAYSAGTMTVKSTNCSIGATSTTGTYTVQGATILSSVTIDADINYSSSSTTLTDVICTGVLTLSAGTYLLDGCTFADIQGTGVTVRAVNTVITTSAVGVTEEYYSEITHTVKEGATPKSGAIVGYWDDTNTDRTYDLSFVNGALTSNGSGVVTGYVRYRVDVSTYTGINIHTGLAAYLKYKVPLTPNGSAISADILLTADANYTATPSANTTINFASSLITQAGGDTTQGVYDYYIQQWFTATNLFYDQFIIAGGSSFEIESGITFTLSSGTLSGDLLNVSSGGTINVNGGVFACGSDVMGTLASINLTVLTGSINMKGGTLDLADITAEQIVGTFTSGTVDLDSLSTPTTLTLDLRSVNSLNAGITIKNDSNENVIVKLLPSQTDPTLNVTGAGTGTLTIDDSPIVTASNLLADSYVRLYNVTQNTELDLDTLVGAGYSFNVPIGTGAGLAEVGDTLRIDVALYRMNGTIYKQLTESGVLANTGITFTGSQVTWTNMETIHAKGGAYKGANVTGFTLDVPNIEIDSSLTEISGWKLATWSYYTIATDPDAMRNYFNAFVDLNLVNFEVNSSNVDLKVDNTGSPATWVDASWTRSDGASIVASTSATIQFANGLINIVSAEGTTAELVDAIYDEATAGHATVGTYGELLQDVDTATAAIQAKTDNLPAAPAAISDIPTAAEIKTEIYTGVPSA